MDIMINPVLTLKILCVLFLILWAVYTRRIHRDQIWYAPRMRNTLLGSVFEGFFAALALLCGIAIVVAIVIFLIYA